MRKQANASQKKERNKKATSLQRKLLCFVVVSSTSLTLTLTLLFSLFGDASKRLYLICIALGLLLFDVAISVTTIRHYLRPIDTAFRQIKNSTYAESAETAVYPEVKELFDLLSQQAREHKMALQQLEDSQKQLQQAQFDINRLAGEQKTEIDPEHFRLFLNGLSTLTATERTVFDHYLDGKSTQEVMALMDIKITTLKYHNRNIYTKCSVSSRSELLKYATFMRQTQEDKASE